MTVLRMLTGFAAASLTVLAVASTQAQTKDWDKVRIATEGAYPPFNAVDSSGKLFGFDVDIANALCEKMQADCTIVAQDWDGIIPGLLAGKYDVIVASMFITEERKQKVSFTEPYYKAAMTYVVPKGSDITDFSDKGLKGKVIGAQAGATQGEYVSAVHPSADIRLYRSQDEVNLDLANGRLDLQVSDLIPMLEWTEKTEDGKCCELVGEPITSVEYVGDGVGMAVRKEDEDLRKQLNEALAQIVADGTYAKINDVYFSRDIYTLD